MASDSLIQLSFAPPDSKRMRVIHVPCMASRLSPYPCFCLWLSELSQRLCRLLVAWEGHKKVACADTPRRNSCTFFMINKIVGLLLSQGRELKRPVLHLADASLYPPDLGSTTCMACVVTARVKACIHVRVQCRRMCAALYLNYVHILVCPRKCLSYRHQHYFIQLQSFQLKRIRTVDLS
jgi:hypothetical protein